MRFQSENTVFTFLRRIVNGTLSFKVKDQSPPDFMSQYTGKLALSPKENKFCSEQSTTDIHLDILPNYHYNSKILKRADWLKITFLLNH